MEAMVVEAEGSAVARAQGLALQNMRVVMRAAQRHSAQIEKQCGVSGAQLWVMQELLERPGLRMGELAGGRVDELAGIADRNPPTLEHRSRAGEGQADRLSETLALALRARVDTARVVEILTSASIGAAQLWRAALDDLAKA